MRPARWLPAATLAGGLLACNGDGPQPGELSVRITAPNAARAIVLRVVGPQVSLGSDAGLGYQVAAARLGGDTLGVMVVAPQGTLLRTGELVRIQVPNVRSWWAYSATPLEVADPNHALHNPVLFTLTVARP